MELGITIGYVRRLRGMSQEQLAERANISRTHLSVIEAPNMACAFSMEVFFNIADALEIRPGDLLNMEPPSSIKRE
ncbi:MAG: helix-turn-helix transcriptional regulator [Clostridia bacterium]|nr:helix-turn-helix transcriptional regulator [Clostridia bacterium]